MMLTASLARNFRMPQLPSGLNLAISRDALIDHGDNWFKCPDGHFWFWVPAPEAGTPPYEFGAEIMRMPEHAPVPSTREEAKRFILVLEMMEDGHYGWRGEWLADFPRYAVLDDTDTLAWKAWLDRPEILAFLDETIARCARMAEVSRSAIGYVAGTVLEPCDDAQQANGMWDGIKMNISRDSPFKPD